MSHQKNHTLRLGPEILRQEQPVDTLGEVIPAGWRGREENAPIRTSMVQYDLFYISATERMSHSSSSMEAMCFTK